MIIYTRSIYIAYPTHLLRVRTHSLSFPLHADVYTVGMMAAYHNHDVRV